MARPSNTAERRAQIVEGLLRVIAREGYADATIAAIAKAAKLAPGLVHYHFESKHEILVALVDLLATRLETRADERLATVAEKSANARLEAFLDAFVALGPDADPHAVAAWVVIGAEAVRDRQVRAVYTRAVRTTLARLEMLVQACGLAPARAALVAQALYAAIEGAYRIASAAPNVLPAGFAAPMLRSTARALLAAEVADASRKP